MAMGGSMTETIHAADRNTPNTRASVNGFGAPAALRAEAIQVSSL